MRADESKVDKGRLVERYVDYMVQEDMKITTYSLALEFGVTKQYINRLFTKYKTEINKVYKKRLRIYSQGPKAKLKRREPVS